MIRKIIKIDETKCNGCGACASACHEGAIGIVNGKACLLREDYCDGLGDCLPACPMNAISFEEREAPAYNEAAVLAAKAAKNAPKSGGCPGSVCQSICQPDTGASVRIPSCLRNFPVQIKLVPVNAPYFDGANFARGIKVPVLMSVGYIDTTCSPSSCYAAFNNLAGEKTMYHMYRGGHIQEKPFLYFLHLPPIKYV